MIMANAIYFKGLWMDEFDPSLSKVAKFYKLNGETIQVPFMYTYRNEYRFASAKDFKVLKLSYGPMACERTNEGRDFSMNVFLPNEKDGLIDLLDQFSSNQDLLDLNFDFKYMEVRKLKLPKFKFIYKFKVSKTLERLGLSMDTLYGDSEMLEGLHGRHKIAGKVMEILHKSCISVDEYGTEAAAVTYDKISGCCMISPPCVDFFVDHPFIFMIREDISKTPIFLGAVVNPLLGD